MTATTVYTPTTDETPKAMTSTPPLRLSLAPAGSAPARIDGAWWPYSRDLTAELPALIDVLDARWGRITRITVNPVHWPLVPHKVQVHGHVVKVGWFKQEQDQHQLMLLSHRVGRWDLLVIPPQTPPGTAAWLMNAAADPLRTATGSRLMAQADGRTAEETQEAPEDLWDSEGGRIAPSAVAEAAA
jgi:Family of unknown function (DUF5994)